MITGEGVDEDNEIVHRVLSLVVLLKSQYKLIVAQKVQHKTLLSVIYYFL